MKNFARRIAIVLSATAVTVGLLGATAAPADASAGKASPVRPQHRVGMS